MNLNNKKNLVFDLDGTLLNNHHVIAEDVASTMIDLKKVGYKMYINTGRPTKAIDHLMATGLFDGYSSYNGGYVDVDNKIIANAVSVSKVLEMLKEFDLGDYSFTTQLEDTLYIDNDRYIEDVVNRTKPGTLTDLDLIPEDDTYSIRLVFPDVPSASRATKMLQEGAPDYVIAHSTGIYVLINDSNASKVNILDLLGRDKCIYFGDSGNDLIVFEEKDIYCIAPSNATKQIRDLADVVLKESNEDNILNIIKGVAKESNA